MSNEASEVCPKCGSTKFSFRPPITIVFVHPDTKCVCDNCAHEFPVPISIVAAIQGNADSFEDLDKQMADLEEWIREDYVDPPTPL